jgi:2-aminoethylphosphonate transport system substrate-binding protein
MPTKRVTAILTALALAGGLAACGGSSGDSDAKEITVYSADGMKFQTGDGFYDKVFADFEKETGIKIKYVEGGSGEMVGRLSREKNNVQADVIIVLPPFIQQADSRGLLQRYVPKGAEKVAADDKDPNGMWTSVVKNYFCFIYNTDELDTPPRTWQDLLDPRFEGKLQYSTPGVAGDGTAVVLKAIHDFGGLDPAMDYLKDLQKNNVGPSSSTGALIPKVAKGELLVSNGDVQMSYANAKSMPNQSIFFVGTDGKAPTTFSLPYAAGLVKNGPHEENAKRFLDALMSVESQKKIPLSGGGVPARADVPATGANAEEIKRAMDGVEVFTPDWPKVNDELETYLDAWREATGS